MRDLTNASKDAPEPVLLAGQVLHLDRAYKLEPQRTVRSTCYDEKLAGLRAQGRKRVEQMEALLFSECRRTSSCTPGDLHLPDCRFDCSEGVIWYHFSNSKCMFILSYFSLHSRGGNRSDVGGGQFTYGGTRLLPCGWGNGIAARLSQLFTEEPAHLIDWVAWLELDRTNSMFIDWSDDQEVRYATSCDRLLIDIAASCHLLRRSDSTPLVPSWSLLSRTTQVSEQLQNPYARSIFAGEALCRLSRDCGVEARTLRWHPVIKRSAWAWQFCGPASLQAESAAILDAIRDSKTGATLRSNVGHYFTATLMDGDMLADVRRLNLIRSEMTFRLARTIGARASLAHGNGVHGLLHRYAMLSEFVRLSADFFGITKDVSFGFDAIGELDECDQGDRAMIYAVMRKLDDFGNSTTMIVNKLTQTHPDQKDYDPRATHARLCFLVSEILCPGGAALY